MDSESEHFFRANTLGGESRWTRTSTTRSGNSKHIDIEELEMLLEPYFVQINGTLNKLTTLKEYVDDTDDYIKIMQDAKQNHLMQMNVILATATLVVSAFVALSGVFGINIHIDLFANDTDAQKEAGMPKFL
ncbi:magnesium transporter MRS2-3-like protein [Tanacetum coccineum]